MKIAK
jgi:hypothetical protein